MYKPVDLVTPEQAQRLGIVTDKPTFLAPEFRFKSNLAPSLLYEVGAMVEAQKSPRARIFAFPDLKTALMYESVGYFGFVPYTGFIAVGEAISEYVMRILGIKAFVKEFEVKHGYVGEFIDTYNQVSTLVIDNDGRLTRGGARYSFGTTERGEILFNVPIIEAIKSKQRGGGDYYERV